MPKPEVKIYVDMTQLDEAIEKANRLVALLEEVLRLLDSLCGRNTK